MSQQPERATPGRTAAPGPRVRPTLATVAELAGVSRATAGRVLAGAAGVSPGARTAVEGAAAQLGYVTNPAARSLMTRRSGSVALVVTESEERFFEDPFFSFVLKGVHGAVADAGLQLVFVVLSRLDDRTRFESFALGGHLDGVVVVSLHGPDPLPQRLRAAGVPVVQLGRPLVADDVPHVDIDNAGGAAAATRHLLARGRRAVATITGPLDMSSARDRLQGLVDELAAAGVELPPERVVEGDYTFDGGRTAMHRLLDEAPGFDALFVASDLMAAGAMQVAQRRGVRVPQDLAVVGFDDLPLAATTDPPLTTVHQPVELMARRMTEVVLAGVRGELMTSSVLSATVVVRGSA